MHDMLEPIQAPLSLRVAGAVGCGLTDLGLPVWPLEPDRICAKARRRAGVTDLHKTPEVGEALERLCRSAVEDAALTPLGRFAVYDMFCNALSTRALWVAHKSDQPKRFETPLRAPLMVVGFPRSGTTLLHRLLALADDVRSLKTWEIQHPMRPLRGADRRRSLTARQIRAMNKIAPSFQLKHPMGPDDPEEDFWLLNTSLRSAAFYTFAPLLTYIEWHREQDMTEPYGLWREMLSSFQADTPDKRLVLKAPIHTAYLSELRQAAPSFGVVQIWRDPVPVVGSLNSLLHTLHALVSTHRDPTELGRRNLEFLSWMGTRNRAARATNDTVLDVRYDDLIADPIGVVESIHQHFGFEMTDAHRSAIEAYFAERPTQRPGCHTYTLEECGLTEDRVRAALRP